MFYRLDGLISNELNSRERWIHCLADITTEEALVWSLARSYNLIKIILWSFQGAFRERWTCAIRKLLSFTYFTVKIFGRCFKKNQEDFFPPHWL